MHGGRVNSMKVYCVFSLESPHRGDSNVCAQYTIFVIKTTITSEYSKSAAMGFFLRASTTDCSSGSRRIVGNSLGSHANNIFSPVSDKLTEVQLYMSTSCKPGSRAIRAFSDVEKAFFYFPIWQLKPPNQKTFQHQRRLSLAAW